MKAAAIVLCAAGLLSACIQRKTVALPVDAATSRPGTREQVLHGTAAQFGITSHAGVWGVLIETGLAEGPATLLALADGTTSVTLDTGDWALRDNGRPRVRAGGARLCELALAVKDFAVATGDYPRPRTGWVRFYFLVDAGVRVAEAEARELGDGRHRLSSLFLLGNDVITRLRIASQGRSAF
jgi:hypothetical protein